MARYTSAYSSFIKRLDEVKILRRVAANQEKTDPIGHREEINAYCRSAIVMLSAHLEAYIEELGEVTLTNIYTKSVPRENIPLQLYYHLSKDFIDSVKETVDKSKIAEAVFSFIETDLEYWERTGTFPTTLPADRFNKNFSNPKFKRIKAYCSRFGYTDYHGDLARLLGPDFNVWTNMVDHLVNTRNKIAHGDLMVTETPADLNNMIKIIRNFCISTDKVFASWCKDNLCAIR